MRRVWILTLGLLLASPAQAYTIHSITASELHAHQAHALRASMADARAQSRLDVVTWLGDPGGGSDLPGAGAALRWHHETSSGFGFGMTIEAHDSTIGGKLAAAELSRPIWERDGRAFAATVMLGYQKMEDGYALSCQDRFGGYSELAVDELDYLALGAALHGEQRLGWMRLSLDLMFTQMRPRLELGQPRSPSVSPCVDEHDEVQNDLLLGAGVAVGGQGLELSGSVLPSMVVLRLSAHF